MNTFLSHESFEASAIVLDKKRLGKQRLEARQLLDTLLGFSDAWKDHPCLKMWKGHEKWLAAYGMAMCAEWIKRGNKDNMLGEFTRRFDSLPETQQPWWLGDERLHSSHRANLVRKDPKRYAEFLGFKEAPQDLYFWPEGVAT